MITDEQIKALCASSYKQGQIDLLDSINEVFSNFSESQNTSSIDIKDVKGFLEKAYDTVKKTQ